MIDAFFLSHGIRDDFAHATSDCADGWPRRQLLLVWMTQHVNPYHEPPTRTLFTLQGVVVKRHVTRGTGSRGSIVWPCETTNLASTLVLRWLLRFLDFFFIAIVGFLLLFLLCLGAPLRRSLSNATLVIKRSKSAPCAFQDEDSRVAPVPVINCVQGAQVNPYLDAINQLLGRFNRLERQTLQSNMQP